MLWWLAYVLLGAFVGFLAGLLGIGGGMTMVPVLAALFSAQSLSSEHAVHLALGTGMAAAMVTTVASVREHHRHGAIDWSMVKRIVPGTVAGTLLSTVASGWIPQRVLALAFALIVYGGAVQILLGRKPTGEHKLPKTPVLVSVGLAIGAISGLVAAGGAFLVVPFMMYCGVQMRSAIASSAAVALPVATIGTIGYVISGLRAGGLPDHSLGFVYVPALIAIVIASVLTAPMGARATHRLPVVTLRRVFAGLLFILATKMLVSYW